MDSKYALIFIRFTNVQKTIPGTFFAYKKQSNPLSIHYKIGCLLAGILYRHEPPVTVVDTATYPLRNTPPNTGGMVMVGWESVGRFGEFRRSNGGCYQVGINRAKFSWLPLLVAYRRKPSLFSSSLSLSSPFHFQGMIQRTPIRITIRLINGGGGGYNWITLIDISNIWDNYHRWYSK